MIPLMESDSILFICSPRTASLEEMKKINVYLSDFPVHDQSKEFALQCYHKRGERELVEKLGEASNQLKILERKLRNDKKRTEDILEDILPTKVAETLSRGATVEAEKFDVVTVLVSDIVGFTSLCGDERVSPMDVIRLLNSLYIKFDSLTTSYDVYKAVYIPILQVETIGDAYVVVSGAPESALDHADRIVGFGLAMADLARDVISPATGTRIQLRLGAHSGPAIAGVLGLKMPKYCLLGEAVTTACLLESLSLPDRLNVSRDTRRSVPVTHVLLYVPVQAVVAAAISWIMENEANQEALQTMTRVDRNLTKRDYVHPH
ncbi:hypothetical protein LAZ67_3002653 [Cordylochernes scorpioides]|uniref:guanylate cyclase n=1 Tax=Cordylochernes scorpioides TaxID=51811 RepID=A0ABY6K893_9ARAC|nr:hypothetical protein LAZ67_3002653 [Cordylochernes scorpioides]